MEKDGALSKVEEFVQAAENCILYARHATRVPCCITGEWPISQDAILDINIKIGEKVDIPQCLVQPDKNGRFSIGIIYDTDLDLELGREMILGHLSLVQDLAHLTI